MMRYALRRLLHMVPTLFGVLVLTFVLFDVVGGSPASIVLGKNASAEALAEYDRQHGHDLPLLGGFRAPVPGIAAGRFAPVAGEDGSSILTLPYALFPGQYDWTPRWQGGEAATVAVTPRWRDAGDAGADVPRRLANGATLRVAVPEGRRLEGLTLRFDGRPPESVEGRWRRRIVNPLDSQFVRYVLRMLRGDLGESTEYRRPVAQVLREGVGVSLALTVPILCVGTAVALLLGLLCAAGRGGRFDRVTLAGATALMSVNYVIWVVAGQYLLAFRWRLFPLWGFEDWTYLALPVAIGVISGLARDVRFYRTVLLDEVGRPHVRTALAKGLAPARVLRRHVLRNSLVPVTTNLSLAIPFLFTGSILLESFFGLPGLGGVGLNAVHSSDVAMVRAVVVVGAVLYQLANVLADLAYAWCDPRVRMR